jgi:hypothetical protein
MEKGKKMAGPAHGGKGPFFALSSFAAAGRFFIQSSALIIYLLTLNS